MGSLKKLGDLFEYQLKDIYSAEQQLKSVIPQMIKSVDSKKLKQVLNDHLNETKTQLDRLNNISHDLDITLTSERCKAMKGLISEAEDFLSKETETNILDAGLIAAAQRIEHYEISAYSTVVEYAKALGYQELGRLLEQSLREERNTNEKLTNLSIDMINVKARV